MSANIINPEYIKLRQESNTAKETLLKVKDTLEDEMHSLFISYGDTEPIEKDIKAIEKAIKVLDKYFK